MKVDMSPKGITQRFRRVAELVRVCRALAGPRYKPASSRAYHRPAKRSSQNSVTRSKERI